LFPGWRGVVATTGRALDAPPAEPWTLTAADVVDRDATPHGCVPDGRALAPTPSSSSPTEPSLPIDAWTGPAPTRQVAVRSRSMFGRAP
jgi:hypothetical protein